MRVGTLWSYAGIIAFGGAVFLNSELMEPYTDTCPLAFEISVIYLTFVAFTISVIVLMVSTRLKQYAIDYNHPAGTIAWLPQNYFVKTTYGVDFEKLHSLTAEEEHLQLPSGTHPQTATSISGFCSSKGSSSNKLLNTITAWAAGVAFSIGTLMPDRVDRYSLIAAGVGLLIIGLAESQYHAWAWAHVFGLLAMLGGFEVMIWHAYGAFDVRTIGLACISLLFWFLIRNNRQHSVKCAVTAIIIEFIMLYASALLALWKYSFGCMFSLEYDIGDGLLNLL